MMSLHIKRQEFSTDIEHLSGVRTPVPFGRKNRRAEYRATKNSNTRLPRRVLTKADLIAKLCR